MVTGSAWSLQKHLGKVFEVINAPTTDFYTRLIELAAVWSILFLSSWPVTDSCDAVGALTSFKRRVPKNVTGTIVSSRMPRKSHNLEI